MKNCCVHLFIPYSIPVDRACDNSFKRASCCIVLVPLLAGVVLSVVGVLFLMAPQDLFNFTGRPTAGQFCIRYRLNKPRPLPQRAVWVSAWQLCWALEERKGWMAGRRGRDGEDREKKAG